MAFHPLQVDLLAGGFPCVSLSMLTTTPGSVLDKGCESGQGYLGMEGAIKTTKPKVILIENVASLFSKRATEKNGESPFLGSSFGWETYYIFESSGVIKIGCYMAAESEMIMISCINNTYLKKSNQI